MGSKSQRELRALWNHGRLGLHGRGGRAIFLAALLPVMIITLVFSRTAPSSSLADLARETRRPDQGISSQQTYTNADLNKIPPDNTVPPRTAPNQDVSIKILTSTIPPATFKTRSHPSQGGEAYWTRRTKTLVAEKARAERRVEEIQSTLNLDWNRFYAASDPAYRDGVIMIEINQLDRQKDMALNDLAKASDALDNLDDDARKAGALPGWVRHD